MTARPHNRIIWPCCECHKEDSIHLHCTEVEEEISETDVSHCWQTKPKLFVWCDITTGSKGKYGFFCNLGEPTLIWVNPPFKSFYLQCKVRSLFLTSNKAVEKTRRSIQVPSYHTIFISSHVITGVQISKHFSSTLSYKLRFYVHSDEDCGI